MRKSTLIFTAIAFALCAGALTPETAWAKKTRVARVADCEWNMQNVVSQCGDYGNKQNAVFVPGGMSGSQGFSGFGDLYQLMGRVCQIGGLGLTIATVAGSAGIAMGSAATGNLPGVIVGGVCLAQQLLGLGMPPPPPTTVRLPNRHQTIFVPMPEQPAPYEYFLRQESPSHEPQAREDVPVAKNESAPAARDPAISVPKPVPAQVPEKVSPKKGKGPEEVAKVLPGTILSPAAIRRP